MSGLGHSGTEAQWPVPLVALRVAVGGSYVRAPPAPTARAQREGSLSTLRSTATPREAEARGRRGGRVSVYLALWLVAMWGPRGAKSERHASSRPVAG